MGSMEIMAGFTGSELQ
jgi:hypothetical protein